jgi:hypothetical protein
MKLPQTQGEPTTSKESLLCGTAIDPAEVTLWVKRAAGHVRFVSNSDWPGGR